MSLSTIKMGSILFTRNDAFGLATAYLQIIGGIILLLLFALLGDLLIEVMPFTFPASAVCMILLFVILLVSHRFSPNHVFRWIFFCLSPASEWVLPNMGVLFSSSFILIPARDPISFHEIGLLCAMFLPPFLATWIGTVLLCQLAKNFLSRDQAQKNDKGSFQDSEPEKQMTVDQDFHCLDIVPSNQTKDTMDLNLHSRVPETELRIENGAQAPHDERRRTLSFDCSNLSRTGGVTQHAEGIDARENKVKNNSSTASFDTTEKPSYIPEQLQDVIESPEQRVSTQLKLWFDPLVFFTLFIVGLPIYYIPGSTPRSLPLFLSTLALAWIFSRRVVPATWQKIFHPLLVTSLITLISIWGLGAIKGSTLKQTLSQFSSGTTFIVLARSCRGDILPAPGAGDVLSSILVAGIISLAFPLFKYRQDLYDNFAKILVVTIPNCTITLLLWPYLAKVIGISSQQAITFAGRFMSTPFGIEFLCATSGDQSLIVVLICVTGILAALIHEPLFKLMSISTEPGSEDYFTMGTTLGVIAGAIGTSSLIIKSPRAAAIATVTFVMYGIILLSLVAIPSIARYVGYLSGIR